MAFFRIRFGALQCACVCEQAIKEFNVYAYSSLDDDVANEGDGGDVGSDGNAQCAEKTNEDEKCNIITNGNLLKFSVQVNRTNAHKYWNEKTNPRSTKHTHSDIAQML